MIQKYWAITKIDFMDRLSHAINQIAQTLIVCVVVYIFIQLWTAIYQGKALIEGFSLAQMIWYLALAETLMFAVGSQRINDIGEEVRDGTITATLLRPLNFVGKEIAILFSNFLSTLLITGSIALIFAFFMVGPIGIKLVTLPFIILAILGSFLVSITFVLSIGMFAFWFEDITAFWFIYTKMVFILGGMLVPIDVYPPMFKALIQYLPFSFIMYYPAKLFVNFTFQDFFITMVGQIIWFALGVSIVRYVYLKGLKKVTINGG